LQQERVANDERFASTVEAAAYFIACEGLTNAINHARANAVTVSARRHDGRLMVSIADDGVGGATLASGSGLRGPARPRRSQRRPAAHLQHR
jgi:signal transduction histidine kinase